MSPSDWPIGQVRRAFFLINDGCMRGQPAGVDAAPSLVVLGGWGLRKGAEHEPGGQPLIQHSSGAIPVLSSCSDHPS